MNRTSAIVALVAITGSAAGWARTVPAYHGFVQQCEASKARGLIGKKRSKKLGADALRRSGARTLRWITPGTMITMDLRQDRLNITLDARNRITKLTCS